MLPIQSLILFGIAIFVAYFFLSGFIWGAGYYPTSRKEIDALGSLVDLNKNSTVYDLGSGYGRMIIGIAEKYGAKTIGIEIDPIKCWWTKMMIARRHLRGRVRVIRGNMLNANLSNADCVFIFLSEETKIMAKLHDKMFREMKPGSSVISFVHKFKSWAPEKTQGSLTLYKVPETKSELGEGARNLGGRKM